MGNVGLPRRSFIRNWLIQVARHAEAGEATKRLSDWHPRTIERPHRGHSAVSCGRAVLLGGDRSPERSSHPSRHHRRTA